MSKKKYVFILIAIIVPIITVTLLIYYNLNNSLRSVNQNEGITGKDTKPEYHFALISENMEDPFWVAIKEGVQQASQEFNVAVEFNWPKNSYPEEKWKTLDMTILSNVDGIVTYVWDEKETGELIDIAYSRGIPVITIGTDSKDSKRAAFVGVNTYSFGAETGRMLLAAIGESGDAVILVNNDDVGGRVIQNILLAGIKESLQDYDSVNLQTVEYSKDSVGNLEDKLKEVLVKQPELDAIICTTEKDTSLVAQTLLDINKLNYNIIGYGDSEEILGYIDRGVIFGTVTASHEEMGYDAIKALVDLKNNGRISAYFNAETHFITKSNVDKYLKTGDE